MTAFLRVKKVIFQQLRMPDDSWNPKELDIALRRPVEIFIPNVCASIWTPPALGRSGVGWKIRWRPASCRSSWTWRARWRDRPINIETLNDQALWDSAPVVPKTPPNPLHNDKMFLAEFPYLAEPW